MPIMLGGRSFIVPAAALALWLHGPGVQAQVLTKPPLQWEMYQTIPHRPPKVWAHFDTPAQCTGAIVRFQPDLKAGETIGCKIELPYVGRWRWRIERLKVNPPRHPQPGLCLASVASDALEIG